MCQNQITFVYFSTITAATWSTNNIVPVSISLLLLPSQLCYEILAFYFFLPAMELFPTLELLSDVPKSDTFVCFTTITAATWSTNNIVPVSISLLLLPSQVCYEILAFYFLTCNGAISYIRTPSIVADKYFFDQFSLLGSPYSPFMSYLEWVE